MGAFDDPRQWTDATSARTRARRAKEAAEREESAVTGRNVLDLEQTVVDLTSRIAVVEHWQDTAQGKDGISVNGNVFSGQRKEAAPPPVTNTYTYEVGPGETFPAWGAGSLTFEIENTGLPDKTPVAVHSKGIGGGSGSLFPAALINSNVFGGTIYLSYAMIADVPPVDMPEGIITVRAILAPGQQG